MPYDLNIREEELKNKVAQDYFWIYDNTKIIGDVDFCVAMHQSEKELDVRERKGSFFTPQIWVELSQKYLTDTFGKDWQDEYYVWDCAAGTGNLLTGLTNKYNIWASTLDKQDVEVMRDRIKNGANLLESHIFQFDFLNDDFSKLPKPLQNIINNPEKRKKLIVYINPPYVEASSYGKNSVPLVANETKIFNQYKASIGSEALSELFAQFFIRIYKEIPNCLLASFSTPKFITSEKFIRYRRNFKAGFLKGFVCNANTFDNVKGHFPIAFLIWDLSKKNEIKQISTTIYNADKTLNFYKKVGTKNFDTSVNTSITSWRSSIYLFGNKPIGYMIIVGPSMQSNNNTFYTNHPAKSYIKKSMVANIEVGNLIEMAVYFAIRHSINTTWLNNKDIFLYPKSDWVKDNFFKTNCLTYMLFSNYSDISSKYGTNHWIPFTEYEVNSREKFESNFMSKFINGKLKIEENADLYNGKRTKITEKLKFSETAKYVFDSGRELWKYYHAQPNGNVNASLYDIREYFQGRDSRGKMKNKSNDETYTKLITELREKLKLLAQKIEPKVYEYGFLKE